HVSRLVLGPLLRFVEETRATVWVETDRPCTVDVLGCRARTFHVAGHHYAIVVVDGLPADGVTPYEVHLDGELVWPFEGWPASVIRTRRPANPQRVAFGSCRAAAPLHDTTYGADALHCLAERMRRQPADEWPDLLMLLGDQVYADDNISPLTLARIRYRRSETEGAGWEVANFGEYTELYEESWSIPAIRWLLSTLPSAMIFDDHDVRDDWNTSATWLRDIRSTSWWQDRIEAALMSYWIYQHLGNLPPGEVENSPLLEQLRDAADGEPVLREFARHADRNVAGATPVRWSYHRDLGAVRLLVVDSRCGRVVDADKRAMVGPEEWAWIDQHARGTFDHLLIATSLPFLLPEGIHHLEAWNEATCAGQWGKRFARTAEQLRQRADLEHWAAFGRSFTQMTQIVADVATSTGPDGAPSGRRTPPATITFLSGDVHFSYLAAAHFPQRDVTARIYQAVCSPLRNPLAAGMRSNQRFGASRAATRIGRALGRSARITPPELEWKLVAGPMFGNQLGELHLAERSAWMRLSGARPGGHFQESFSAQLS
ncbi:MAG: alkaline phosphatase D family protein, partial [Frankiaceae bacterium]